MVTVIKLKLDVKKNVIAGTENGLIIVYHRDGTKSQIYTGEGAIGQVVCKSDEQVLFVQQNFVKLLDRRKDNEIVEKWEIKLLDDEDELNDVVCIGGRIFVAGDDGNIFDVRSGTVSLFPKVHGNIISQLAVHQDRLLSVGLDSKLHLWDVNRRKVLYEFDSNESLAKQRIFNPPLIHSVCWGRPSKKEFYCGCQEGSIVYFQNFKFQKLPEYHSNIVFLDFKKKNKILFSADIKGNIGIWKHNKINSKLKEELSVECMTSGDDEIILGGEFGIKRIPL